MQAVSGVSNIRKEGMVGLFSYLSEGKKLLSHITRVFSFRHINCLQHM